MQFMTLMKFGGLAFDVVQDEKVRELAGMIHKGARRRGLLGDFTVGGQGQGGSAAGGEQPHPIPFAPEENSEKAKAEKPERPPGLYLPPQVGLPKAAFGKYMNAGNAQMLKKWAAEIGQHLITK